MISAGDIADARERIGGLVRATPLARAPYPGMALFWKLENLQVTGSFKARGALNALALLAGRSPGAQVVAHSSGNHAIAVAHAAAAHGLRTSIVMPTSAPQLKVDRILQSGAALELVAPQDRARRARELACELGAYHVSSDDAEVIAGAGTTGVEILDDLPEVGTILVPVCTGSQLAGIAVAVKAIRPDVAVVGVEPELSAVGRDSFTQGRLVRWPEELTYRTIADGLRAPSLGPRAWEHIRLLVDDIVTVTEDEIEAAQTWMSSVVDGPVEPSAAVTTAAALAHPFAGSTVALVTGGNVAPQALSMPQPAVRS